jgi:hypothetical protein
MLVEYPATRENCLEPIIGHTMSSKPPSEQVGEDRALDLPILTVQDRTDPIDERLDFIHFFVVRVPHVTNLCRLPSAQHPLPDWRFYEASAASAGRLARGAKCTAMHTSAPSRYMCIAHISSRLADFSPGMPRPREPDRCPYAASSERMKAPLSRR